MNENSAEPGDLDSAMIVQGKDPLGEEVDADDSEEELMDATDEEEDGMEMGGPSKNSNQ